MECALCKRDVTLEEVYRCYDCDKPFHKQCLIDHCKESQDLADRHADRMTKVLDNLRFGGYLLWASNLPDEEVREARKKNLLMYDAKGNKYILVQ